MTLRACFVVVTVSICTSYAAESSLPTEFYIVSDITSDADPFWYRYILQVTPKGSGSLVRYIRIAPDICSRVPTVQVAAVSLPDVSPSSLAAGHNLCSTSAAELLLKIPKRRSRKPIEIDDSVRFGIVEKCGSNDQVFYLPYPEAIDFAALRKRSPELAGWWDLSLAVKTRAFGESPHFDENAGELLIPELRSGIFDKGLQTCCRPSEPCQARSFRDDLATYVPIALREPPPQLLEADTYKFIHFRAPAYPIGAIQARLSGTVKLTLAVDPETGVVRDVTFVSGHPLFHDSAIAAAKSWQLVPGSVPPNGTLAASLKFFFRPCFIHTAAPRSDPVSKPESPAAGPKPALRSPA